MQSLFQGPEQLGAVAKPGQIVLKCLLFQPLPMAFVFGDVL